MQIKIRLDDPRQGYSVNERDLSVWRKLIAGRQGNVLDLCAAVALQTRGEN